MTIFFITHLGAVFLCYSRVGLHRLSQELMQMNCAWEGLLSILPLWIRGDVVRLGRDNLQELRLRVGESPMLVLGNGERNLEGTVNEGDVQYVINGASRYSPWAAATAAQGYLTAKGGHRIGICGEAVVQQGYVTGIRKPISLCIRVARDFPGIAAGLPGTGSLLILGPPGAGKTTLLRDLIRLRSNLGPGSVAVVDEREELFPPGIPRGRRTDVLSGAPKAPGMEMALRTMGPGTIAVDEITAERDCDALLHAGGCGVTLLATAHAASRVDLAFRPIYRKLVEYELFEYLVILQRDKSWRLERMCRG